MFSVLRLGFVVDIWIDHQWLNLKYKFLPSLTDHYSSTNKYRTRKTTSTFLSDHVLSCQVKSRWQGSFGYDQWLPPASSSASRTIHFTPWFQFWITQFYGFKARDLANHEDIVYTFYIFFDHLSIIHQHGGFGSMFYLWSTLQQYQFK